MHIYKLVAFATAVLMANRLVADQTNATLDVGDHLVIELSGDAAQEYRKRTIPGQSMEIPRGLRIETFALIQQRLDDGHIRIEHSVIVKSSGGSDRLVTLSGNVDPKRISTQILPKQPQVFVNPSSDPRPIGATTEHQAHRLAISDLKGLKLRTWTLSEEIGD